ncbi:MAG: hypothetical protein AB7L13_05140 [Acidimicrobiia bacterium]
MGAVGNVVVGLTFFILLLALIASAVAEAIGGVFQLRAGMLDRTLRAVLTGIWPTSRKELTLPPSDPTVAAFLTDPRASIGYPGKFGKSKRPSYLPTDRFVDLVFAHYLRPGDPHPLEIDTRIAALEDSGIGGVLQRLWADAAGDVDVLRDKIGSFYDATMSRCSGGYRRRTRWMLFAIGVALAVGLNVNVFTTGRLLWSNQALSSALTNAASQQAPPSATSDVAANVATALSAYRQAADSGLPFGWGNDAQPHAATEWAAAVFGWLLIAGAVSFGAPFWFDVLGRFVNVRISGTPPDKQAGAGREPVPGRAARITVPMNERPAFDVHPLGAGSATTAFDPTKHGFHFDNDFVNSYRLPFGGDAITTYGRCGGMVYACLDLYRVDQPVPAQTDVPIDGTPLADYLMERLVDSWLNPSATRFVTWTPKNDATLAALTSVEIETVCATLDTGQPAPMGLIGGRDLAGIGHNHQVLAIGYRRYGDGTTEIDTYDNNYHDVVTTLTYRPGAYGLTSSRRALPWRGAFAHSYSAKEPPNELGVVVDVRGIAAAGTTPT